jgi:formamidopyrimidine-DNA glycosylase
MPELPEVETAARSLASQVLGRQIVAVERLDWERMVEAPDVSAFRALLPGRTILAVRRRAKWLLADLDAGWTLALHLRMSGSIIVQSSDEPADHHTHLVLQLDDGRRIFFRDVRKFGRVRLLDAEGLAQLDARYGGEPLEASFTPDTLRDLLRGRRTRIKPLLLDQSSIAGLGNIYTDEALWRARIHPLRSAASLTNAESDRLYEAIRSALALGLEHGGSTLRDYRNGYGEKGHTQEYFNVYDRKGQPCSRCGTLIERIVVAQRGTHICPTCQILDTAER